MKQKMIRTLSLLTALALLLALLTGCVPRSENGSQQEPAGTDTAESAEALEPPAETDENDDPGYTPSAGAEEEEEDDPGYTPSAGAEEEEDDPGYTPSAGAEDEEG